jgi:uncharacterized ferritin-like protein (DUF455 family)
MDPNEIRLFEEQLRHALDLLNNRLETLETRLGNTDALAGLRLSALEHAQADHEARLRAVADAVVRLTTATSLAQVGQAAFAVILTAIAAYLGRK